MKCPYCEKEMEKGEVQIGDSIQSFLKANHAVLWAPENESKKMVPKNAVHLSSIAEGYYCDKCVKVIGIFDEKGTTFLQ